MVGGAKSSVIPALFEQPEQSEQRQHPEQYEQPEQSEQRQHPEQSEQYEQREQPEQREQSEQREQPEQHEQYEQPEQFEQLVQSSQSIRLSKAFCAASVDPQYSTEHLLFSASVIHVVIAFPPTSRLHVGR